MKPRLLAAHDGKRRVRYKPQGRQLAARLDVLAQVGHAGFFICSKDDANPAGKPGGRPRTLPQLPHELDHDRGTNLVVHAAAAVEHAVLDLRPVRVARPAGTSGNNVQVHGKRHQRAVLPHLGNPNLLSQPRSSHSPGLALQESPAKRQLAPLAVRGPRRGRGVLRVDAHQVAQQREDPLVAKALWNGPARSRGGHATRRPLRLPRHRRGRPRRPRGRRPSWG